MPVNKRSKYRGSRTCGGGTHKNRRGAGNRGGRGRAGLNAHRFAKFYLEDGGPVYGKNGFNHSPRIPVRALDIGTINQMVDELIAHSVATKDGDTITLDTALIDVDKVLGSGRVTARFNITAKAFSEQAKAKIEAMGGQALIV